MEENQMVESNQTCDAVVHSLMRLLEIQDDIDTFHEHMIDLVLGTEEESNRRCKPLYDKRNEVIHSIPHLWRIVFSCHPVIHSFMQLEDYKIFVHFTSLEVEEFKDGKCGYSITLNFEANPYFEDTKLTKTFTFVDERTIEITATPIKWKDGMVPNVAPVNKQKIKPVAFSHKSFFTWFSLMEEKVICEDFEDKLAESIKEDLWPNPLSYFAVEGTSVAYVFSSQCNPEGGKADDAVVTEKAEVECNQMNPALIDSFEVLLEIQDDIDKINNETIDKILEVEQAHNKISEAAYFERNEIIKRIPGFWQIVLLSHPVLTLYIKEEDEKILKHLISIEVEGHKDHDKAGYSITFKFEPNPYFEDTKLTKTFTFLDERSTEISATFIKWKEGMVPNGDYVNKGHALRPMGDESFFMWFGHVELKSMCEGLRDEIADSIKEDLWPNPLSYFYTEPDGYEHMAKRRVRNCFDPRLGDSIRGCSSSVCQYKRRAIRLSRYISEPQKFRSLEGKRCGWSFNRLQNHAFDVLKFLQSQKKCGQLERSEEEATLLHIDSMLVTWRIFGCPIIRSLSKMLSEYYWEKYGLFLEVVEVLRSSEGQSFSFDRAQCAKWFHLNFKANVKDGDGVSQKLYFAELLVFRSRFSLCHCHVAACLPVNLDVSGPCKCLFSKHDPEIYHPSIQVYVDDTSLLPPVCIPLPMFARLVLEEFAGSKSTKSIRSTAWITPQYDCTFIPRKMRYASMNRTKASVEGGREFIGDGIPIYVEEKENYLYRSQRPTRMSRDIPVPYTILSLQGKRKGTSLVRRHRRALAMANRIEDCRKPRHRTGNLAVRMLISTFLTALPECYKHQYGIDLEEVNGLTICEVKSFRPSSLRNIRWFHMNFTALLKDDDDACEQLYFAEVVVISCAILRPQHIMTVCVAVDQNDPGGNSSKCGICIPDLQIRHPNPGSYIADASMMDPNIFTEWKENEELLRKRYTSCRVI